MSFKKWLLGVVTIGLCCGTAMADILIDPDNNNGSFELAGGAINTTKIQVWDGTPDVDNWSVWTEVSTADDDSGVENTGNASDGSMVAFMQGGNAMHNMTTWLAAEGDEFYFSWDHVLRADRDHSVSLVYDNGGVITAIAESQIDTNAANGEGFTYSGTFTIPALSPAIGNAIGLGVVSPGAYPEIDNFILTVNEDAPVEGDVDGDGDVDLIDYGIIRDNFRLSPATKAQGDLTGADIVDFQDFLLWRNSFPGGAAAAMAALGGQRVPEPFSWLLVVVGSLVIGSRRIHR